MHFQRGHPSDLSSLESSLGSSLSDALHFSFALNDNILNENNGHARIDSLPRTRLFSDWDKRMVERIKKKKFALAARSNLAWRLSTASPEWKHDRRTTFWTRVAVTNGEIRFLARESPRGTSIARYGMQAGTSFARLGRSAMSDSGNTDCQRCFRECIGRRLRRTARPFRRYACRKLATMEWYERKREKEGFKTNVSSSSFSSSRHHRRQFSRG